MALEREGDGQLAGRVLVAKNQIGDDVAVFLTGEPDFQNGRAAAPLPVQTGIHGDASGVILQHQCGLGVHGFAR